MGNNSKQRKFFIILLSVATLFAIADLSNVADGQLDTVKKGTTQVFKPFQSGLSRVVGPLGDWFSGVTKAGELKRENEKLKKENDELNSTQKKADAAIQENKRLIKQLRLELPEDIPVLNARVIAGSPSNFQNTMQIDVGSNDGVEKGMPVMSGDGLIGKVLKSSKNNSIVLLVNDPTFAVGAQSISSGTKGIVKGKGDGTTLSLQFVEDPSIVKKNEVITTTGGDESLFPAGLSIGVVNRRTSTDIEIEIPREPEQETVVTVLLTSKE